MTTGRAVCLIAGAGPGIGQAVARRFAKEGFTIVAVRRNKEQLQTLAADIANSGKIIGKHLTRSILFVISRTL